VVSANQKFVEPISYAVVFNGSVIAGRMLQKKWKNLRDCFSRDRRSRKSSNKSGSAATSSKKTSYVYYDQLAFLEKVKGSKSTTSNFSSKDSSTDSSSGAIENVPQDEHDGSSSEQRDENCGKAKKKKLNKVHSDSQEDAAIIEVLKHSIKNREEREKNLEDDDDRLFLLSLLNPLKKVPEARKLQVRAELMQVVISNSSHSTNYNPLFASYPYNQADVSYSVHQPDQSSTSGGITGFNY